MADPGTRISLLPPIAALQQNDLVYVLRGDVDYRLVVSAKMIEDFVPVDYAGIRFDDNAGAQTIDLVDLYHLVTDFDEDGPDAGSVADQVNNRNVFGASRRYWVYFQVESDVVGASQTGVYDVFSIDQNAVAITGITQANPGVVTTGAAHGLSNGDRVKITGVVGMVTVNDKIFTVANVGGGGTTFELTDDEGVNVNTGGFGAWVSDGTTQKATETKAHTDQKYDNGALESASCGFPFVAVKDDWTELYFKNGSSDNNIIHEGGVLTIHALSY